MEKSLIKIIFVIQISYLLSCSALPLTPSTSPVTTIQPATTQKPIVFSHDANPFDPKSYSFRFGSIENISTPNFKAFGEQPIIKHHSVLPLEKPSNMTRQQRIHVFRPLFVYRQEQMAMRRRATVRPPIAPPHYYPYYPYHQYHYQHQHQHQHAHQYPDYYDSFPHKNFDYISNDLTNTAPDYWY